MIRTAARLAAMDTTIEVAYARLPLTLSHGDPNGGNIAIDGARIVLFDWDRAHLSAPGTDLAKLLWGRGPGLPRPWRAHPGLEDAALTAYHAQLREHGVGHDDVLLGYLMVLERYWLRGRVASLARASAEDLAARPPARVARVHADVARLCDHADHLAALVG